MQLTPLPLEQVPTAIARVGEAIAECAPGTLPVLSRIGRTLELVPLGVDTPTHRATAVALCRRVGLAAVDEEPARSFSWDGRAVRTRTEASVLIHEVAHWQVCPPERRGLPDFGLGAGPETGRRAQADAARAADDGTCLVEEQMASLLGILWEAELGQPAILAFLEQNWLEGWQRPATAEHFARILDSLKALGVVDDDGRPLPVPRRA